MHNCMLSLILFYFYSAITKKLIKLGKEKGFEVVAQWRKACVRHFHWAVTSTEESRGAVKLAKFQAFLSHVINKHKDVPSKIFNKCAHGDVTKKHMWLTKGIHCRVGVY